MAQDFVECPDCGHGVAVTERFCPTCRVPIEWVSEVDEATTRGATETTGLLRDDPWWKVSLGIAGGLLFLGAALHALDDASPVPSHVIAPFNGVIPDPTVYVYVDEPPTYLTRQQADTAAAAVTGAIDWWNERGNRIERVYHEEAADMILQYIKDWGGETLGQQYGHMGGLLQIGLGDSECRNEWTPYSGRTVALIAVHEIGHGLGYDHSDDPDDVMHPTMDTEYADYCKIWDGTDSWDAGNVQGIYFEITTASSIKYDVQERDNGALDVCIMDRSDWDQDPHDLGGYACHDDVNYARDSANIPAGRYVLAMRCENWYDNCVADYVLWQRS